MFVAVVSITQGRGCVVVCLRLAMQAEERGVGIAFEPARIFDVLGEVLN